MFGVLKSAALYFAKLTEQIVVLTICIIIALIIAFNLVPIVDLTKPAKPYQCNAIEKKAHLPECETSKP